MHSPFLHRNWQLQNNSTYKVNTTSIAYSIAEFLNICLFTDGKNERCCFQHFFFLWKYNWHISYNFLFSVSCSINNHVTLDCVMIHKISVHFICCLQSGQLSLKHRTQNLVSVVMGEGSKEADFSPVWGRIS